jgi:hypothetical protein
MFTTACHQSLLGEAKKNNENFIQGSQQPSQEFKPGIVHPEYKSTALLQHHPVLSVKINCSVSVTICYPKLKGKKREYIH